MVQEYQLNDNEKELLTVLGSHQEMSLKELVNHTQYKRESSVVRKIRQLGEQDFLQGPVYKFDFGKLCKNPLHGLFCIIELGKDYETVVAYLKVIESLVWLYPVLSSHKEFLGAGFLSSNDAEVKALLQLLKDSDIIADYTVRVRCCRDTRENPDFFGNPVPSLDKLLNPCEFPDISFGSHDIDWTECDIAILSHLHGGYKSIKLIEILKKERKLHNREWTYNQIKYSHEKMIKNKLINKIYYIFPYKLDQCADFFLFLKTEDVETTQRILYNFARGGRIYREYTLCDSWGQIGCICHPAFVIGLMHRLDQIEEIMMKELYHLRSFPPGIRYVGGHSEFVYYDVETQTLEYPYHIFKEKIKEKLENELDG
ncbi:MAG: hypothetical protein HXS46_02505 [Theionarchaea archaeon]|nr:MAG: hypothetical protein AYK18_04925 [Theionarchaea archaeon DG-70]MBU7009535.1 hypothetical protein [Theionarchaea archaeon]